MNMTPVYLFTGFLEAGKTKAIRETIEDERFTDGEKNLILLCEEGIEEYDLSRIPGGNTVIEVIKDSSQLNCNYLSKLHKRHKPDKVVVEYNGMWKLDDLYNAMPKNWGVYQEIFIADCKTFESYNVNMRPLVVDKLQTCELVVFNRPILNTDRTKFHKIVRGLSRKTNIAYEMYDGTVEYDETEDPLPFDINADIINIDDRDYALWFRDFAEDIKKYIGKTIRTTVIVGVNKNLPKGTVVAGRHVMTCCVDDIEFKGIICKCDPDNMPGNKQWVKLTANITYEYNEVYKNHGPVLNALEIAPSSAPEQEVATFY